MAYRDNRTGPRGWRIAQQSPAFPPNVTQRRGGGMEKKMHRKRSERESPERQVIGSIGEGGVGQEEQAAYKTLQ